MSDEAVKAAAEALRDEWPPMVWSDRDAGAADRAALCAARVAVEAARPHIEAEARAQVAALRGALERTQSIVSDHITDLHALRDRLHAALARLDDGRETT